MPIDDDDIYSSQAYITIVGEEFDRYVSEKVEKLSAEKVEDFVNIVAPVTEQAAKILEQMK